MSSPDKISTDHILDGRTRSEGRYVDSMVSPHPDDEDDEEEDLEMPELEGSSTFETERSDSEPEHPPETEVTVAKKKSVLKKKRGRRPKQVPDTSDPEEGDDVPDLVGGRDSSAESRQNIRRRSVKIITPNNRNNRNNKETREDVPDFADGRDSSAESRQNIRRRSVKIITPASRNDRKNKEDRAPQQPGQSRKKTTIRTRNVYETSADDSNYDTAVEIEPEVLYHVRRPNFRRKLTRRPVHQQDTFGLGQRLRHRAGGDANRQGYHEQFNLPREELLEEDDFTDNCPEYDTQPIHQTAPQRVETDPPKFDGSGFAVWQVQF